jgi:hypothetical protein
MATPYDVDIPDDDDLIEGADEAEAAYRQHGTVGAQQLLASRGSVTAWNTLLETHADERSKRNKELDDAAARIGQKLRDLDQQYEQDGKRGRPSKSIAAQRNGLNTTLRGITEDRLLPAEQEQREKERQQTERRNGDHKKDSIERLKGESSGHFAGASSAPVGSTKGASRTTGARTDCEEEEDTDDTNEWCKKRTTAQEEFIKSVLDKAKSKEVGQYARAALLYVALMLYNFSHKYFVFLPRNTILAHQ